MNAPLEILACEACGGAGYTVHFVMVYELSCGFPHGDTEERRCRHCDGLGEFIREAEGSRHISFPSMSAARAILDHSNETI